MSEDAARACVAGDKTGVTRALGAGLNPNSRYRGRTLLHWAVQEGRDAVVALLLAAGADPNAADGGRCRAKPLHTAAGSGHVRVVRRLLRAGGKPSCQARGMGTPLHLAAAYGHLHCVKALVKAGADVGVRDAEGRRPSHFARMYRHGAVLRFLHERESA
jgi:ankyrin repeat protein